MQLSLRSLLLAIWVLALILALGAWATKDYRREQSIRHTLLSLGADDVRVDIQEGRPNIWLTLDSAATAAELAKYSHLDLSQIVIQIVIEGEVTREMLAPLANLKELRFLHFHQCAIDERSDLQPLRNLEGLKALIFSNSSINEKALGEIGFVPNLKDVIFHTTDIAPEPMERLATSLPNVCFYATDGISGATNAPRVWPKANEPTDLKGAH